MSISASDLGVDLPEHEEAAQPGLNTAEPPRSVKIDLRTKEGRRLKAEAEQNGTPLNLFQGETTQTRKRGDAPKKNVEHIRKVLVSVHARVAIALAQPDLAIDDEEGQMLAESGAALLDYYKIKIDGKRGATVAFIYALTLVY